MSLKFKGDKVKKKKRSHKEIDDIEDKGEGSSTDGSLVKSARQRYGKDPQGWILGQLPEDLVGPLFVTSKSSLAKEGQPLSLTNNPINFKVYPYPMPADMTAETAEPTQIESIWRCARVPESDDKITLKSAQDRYLACDQVGVVSAEREARGAQEEWVFVSVDENYGRGAFALQNAAWGKYLSVDEVAGGKLELRCDLDTVGESGDEVWYCKMQAEFIGKTEDERRKKQRVAPDSGLTIVKDLRALENTNIRKYQARGEMKSLSVAESTKELRKAQKEGRIAEAMLDRRSKLKSDKFC